MSAFLVRFVAKDMWRTVALHDQKQTISSDRPENRPGKVSDLLEKALMEFHVRPQQHRQGPSSNGTIVTPSCDQLTRELVAQYGLYLPHRGHWMENDRQLSFYRVRQNDAINTDKDGCQSVTFDPTRTLVTTNAEVIELQHRRHFVRTDAHRHYAEGYLLKKGDRSLVWKERFFILRNETLYYYKTRGDTVHKGTIDLSVVFKLNRPDATVSDDLILTDRLQFCITTSEKTYRLKAADIVEVNHWLRILRRLQYENYQRNTMKPALSASVLGSHHHHHQSDELPSSEDEASSDGGDSDAEDLVDTFGHLRLNGGGACSALRRSHLQDVSSSLPKSIFDSGLTNIDIQADKIGLLYKKGKVNRSLKPRLFILRDKILFYYKSVKNADPQRALKSTNYEFAGLINLEGCRIHAEHRQSGRKAHIFRIVTPGRVFVLSTSDATEWRDWRDAFEFICGIIVDENPTTLPMSPDDSFDQRHRSILKDDSGDESLDEDHGLKRSNTLSKSKPHKVQLRLDFARLGCASGEPDFEGTLLKLGNDRLKKWRTRWFCLAGRTLFYSFPAVKYAPIGSIPLSLATIEKPDLSDSAGSEPPSPTLSAGELYGFDLVMRNRDLSQPVLRRYHLRCLNRASFQRWIDLLALHTGASKQEIQALLA